MFGYTESAYKTVASKTIERNGVQVQIERRIRDDADLRYMENVIAQMGAEYKKQLQTRLDLFTESREYIVILGNNGPHYLLYQYGGTHQEIPLAEAQLRLAQDWETLSTNPDINIKQLRWCELIHNDLGQTDFGCVSMY